MVVHEIIEERDACVVRRRGGGAQSLPAAGLAMVRVDEHMAEDGDQPGFRVGAARELIPGPIRAEQRVLHQVVRVCGVSHKVERDPEQRVEVNQRFGFEAELPAGGHA